MELYIDESKKNPGALLYDSLTKESLYRITNSHKHTLITKPNPIEGTEEEKVADIEWSILGTTQLISSVVGGGKPTPAKTIIESKRLGRHYIFSGPDGRSYRWKEKTSGGYKLTTNDDAKNLVAEYKEKKQTLFCSMKRPARLEIMPSGTSMMDMVVLTFAYVQKKNSRGKEMGEGIGVLGEVVGAVVGA